MTDNGQLPPSDVAAERALLGALLINPAGLAAVAHILAGTPFWRPTHQAVYNGILALAGRGEPIEPPAVLSELLRATTPASAAAAAELPGLVSDISLITDPGYYATKIADAAERRRIIEAATRLRQHSYGTQPIEELRAAAAATLATILDDTTGIATGLQLTAADTMTMKAPRWLDDRRIPAGAITLLAGREGIGKSTLALDIAARLTRGELRGTRYGHPAGVAVVATEDQWAEVILPRLVAARADLSRVYQVEAADHHGATEYITLPADLPALKTACARRNIAMLILDPIMSVIAANLDTHKDREVRQALDPLARFAADTDTATLGLIHVNKSGAADPNNSMMGSRAFPAVARSVLYCIADPESEEGAERYLFCHTKSNLGPRQLSISYELQEAGILLDQTTGETIPTSRVRWGAEDRRTAADVMDSPRDRAAGELATTILEWMQAPDRVLPVPAADIVSNFPGEKPDTVRKNLNRMAARGVLTKPIYGHFALPAPELDAQVGHPVRTIQPVQPVQPVQPSRRETSYMSKKSNMSNDDGRLDRLDRTDTLDGTGGVSNPPSNPTTQPPPDTDHTNYGPCTACGTHADLPADGLCFTCWTRGIQPPSEPDPMEAPDGA